MGVDMEMSCDERVLKEMGEDTIKDYSLSLLSLATERCSIGVSPLAFGEGGIKGRIKNVLNFRKPSRIIIVMAVALITILSVGFAMNRVSSISNMDIVRGNGNMVARTFQTNDFTSIDIGGFYNITYRQSDDIYVVLEMSENLFEYYDVSVRNKTLRVTQQPGVGIEQGAGNSPSLYIYAPYLTEVRLSASTKGNDWDTIKTKNLKINITSFAKFTIPVEVENLTATVSNSGKLELHGNAGRANMSVSSFGNISANDLQAVSVTTNISGTGTIKLVESELNDISMNIQGVTPSGLSFSFENTSDKEYIYSEEYRLFVYEAGNWFPVEPVIPNGGFNEPAYLIFPQSQTDAVTVDWQWLYGELPSGYYKFQKGVLYWRSPGDFDRYALEQEFMIP
jgi:hypothetical protein